MLFNSIEYCMFLPIIIFLYFKIPQKYKNIFLLIASYCFYMSWIPQYAILLMASTILTYLPAFLIEKSNNGMKKKALLILAIAMNLGPLLYFKYFNFFIEILNPILSLWNIANPIYDIKLLLPVGISFYTFQSLSYLIDIYRKQLIHERNFINFALYISFFPRLVAGPIERADSFLPQLRETHTFVYGDALDGMRTILLGMFKKVAIADSIALYVNAIYGEVETHTGLSFLLATFLFSVQIYCDFSGYTDVARGSAKILGFKLAENFNSPLMAVSISDFWKRWHISLSTWFRDYVYRPISTSLIKKKWKFNSIYLLSSSIVWLLTGLWHGASWNFIVWGALHGLYLIADNIWLKSQYIQKLNRISSKRFVLFLKTAGTYILICIAWIFFRANSLSDAVYIIKNSFSINMKHAIDDILILRSHFPSNTFIIFYIVFLGISIGMLFLLNYYRVYKMQGKSLSTIFINMNKLKRRVIYFILASFIFLFFAVQNGSFSQTGNFIYFQF